MMNEIGKGISASVSTMETFVYKTLYLKITRLLDRKSYCFMNAF